MPNGLAPPQSSSAGDVGQLQLQQLAMLQQAAALGGVLPFLPYSALPTEALAGAGLSAEALSSMEALSAINMASAGNLADLTNLLRQHAQVRVPRCLCQAWRRTALTCTWVQGWCGPSCHI